ncbi:MAG: hypothetical protein ACI9QD_000269 [Thermoproteota archaeon]|jgi:hypothetical protein
MKKLIFLLLLISTKSFAQDSVFLQICSLNDDSKRMLKFAKKFASSHDSVEIARGGCVEVITRKVKEDLFLRIFPMKFPNAKIKSSSWVSKDKESCRLSLRKVFSKNEKASSISLNKRSRARSRDIIQKQTEVFSLVTQQNYPSILSVDDSSVHFKCRILPDKTYMIELFAGSKKSTVSVSISLVPGQSIEVGSYFKDLDSKAKSIGIPSGVQLNKSKGHETQKTYISIKGTEGLL